MSTSRELDPAAHARRSCACAVLVLVAAAGTCYGTFAFFFREDFVMLLRPRNLATHPIEGPILPVDAALLVLVGVWAIAWVLHR